MAKQVTVTEKAVFDAWKEKMPFISMDTHIDLIRGTMKKTAYHEAAHATVKAFWGDNHSHFGSITIIPTGAQEGIFSQKGVFMPPLDVYPDRLKWIWGHMEMIHLLAGDVAGSLIDEDSYYDVMVSVGDWQAQADSIDEFRSRVDAGRALVISELLDRPGWPSYRILRRAEIWTRELLAQPEIWCVIEKVAQRLLEVGAINNFYTYNNLVSE